MRVLVALVVLVAVLPMFGMAQPVPGAPTAALQPPAAGLPILPPDAPGSLVFPPTAASALALPASLQQVADSIGLPTEDPLLLVAPDRLPHIDVLPTEWAIPYPVDDLDGDGHEEWALLEVHTEHDDGSNVVVLSGATGAVMVDLRHDAAFSMWGTTFRDGPDTFFSLYSCDKLFEVEDGDYIVEFCSWTLRLYDASTFAPVWSYFLPAAITGPSSGYLEYAVLGLPGRHATDDLEILFHHGRYSWDDSIFLGVDEPIASSLRGIPDGAVRYTLPLTEALPAAVVDEGPQRGFVVPTEDGLALRSVIDYGVLWSRTAAELGFDVYSLETVHVGGAPRILVLGPSTEPGVQGALLATDGTLEWQRFLPGFWRFHYAMGYSTTLDATQIGTGHVRLDLEADELYYRYGVMDAGTGTMQWLVEDIIPFPDWSGFGIYLSIGDFTGDGVSELLFSNWTGTIQSLASLEEPLSGDTYYLMQDIEFDGRIRIHASADGAIVHEWTLDELPGSLLLAYGNPTTPVDMIPYGRVRLTQSFHWQLFYHELFIGNFDPDSGESRETIADVRIFNPVRVGGNAGYRAGPLNLYGGPLDRAYVFWYHRAGYEVDDHSRIGLYTHDVATLEQVWRYETASPLDLAVPHDVAPLPSTPFD